MNHEHHTASAAWYKSPAVLGLLAILGAAGAFLLVQHWEHAGPYSPWLLILAIPLLHMFMHGGHGAHGGHGSHGGHDSREGSGRRAGHGGGCCGGQSSRAGHGGHGSHGSRADQGGDEGQGGGCCGGKTPKKDVKQPVGQVDR